MNDFMSKKTREAMRLALSNAQCPLHLSSVSACGTDGIQFGCGCFLTIKNRPLKKRISQDRSALAKRKMNAIYGLTERERAERDLPCARHNLPIHIKRGTDGGIFVVHNGDESICRPCNCGPIHALSCPYGGPDS